jgi:hypothetical protein
LQRLCGTLGVPEKESGVGAGDSSKEPRESQSLLVGVLRKAEQSNDTQDVAKLLRRLRSSKAWKACMKHRNDWVHNRIPAIHGIFPSIVFSNFGKELSSEVCKSVGLKRSVAQLSYGAGQDISIVRETVRNAYVELFAVYEEFLKLLARKGESIG